MTATAYELANRLHLYSAARNSSDVDLRATLVMYCFVQRMFAVEVENPGCGMV